MRQIRRPRRIKSIPAPRAPIPRAAVRARRPPPLIKEFVAVSPEQQRLAELESRAVPATQVVGTILERIVYKALAQRGIAFDFQSSLFGGRPGWMFGRQVADFALWQQRIVIEVQGAYWHSPLEQQFRDKARELVLHAEGWTTLYLEEADIVDPIRLDRWLRDHVFHALVVPRGYAVSTALAA